MQLNDLCKYLHRPDSDFDELRGDAETLAGLVLEILGRFPKQGEVLQVADLRLTVEAVNNRRIVQIKIETGE